MAKQPFGYYGGKQRMATRILPLLPRHTVYCEPFAGGASIFWRKPLPGITNSHHYREVLNDTNGLIANFYQQLRDNGEELQRLVANTEYGHEVYRECKTICKGGSADPLKLAWAWMVNLNMSFGHKFNGGWGSAVYGKNSAGTWDNLKNISPFTDRLRGVHIDNVDALDCIRKWDSPQTCFYCDPPYPGTSQGHYGGYTVEDFRRLVDALEGCQGSFLLSCYPQNGVPDHWERFEFATSMSVSKSTGCRSGTGQRANTARTEMVWRRFNRVPVRPEIARLYQSGAYACFASPPGEASQLDMFDKKSPRAGA